MPRSSIQVFNSEQYQQIFLSCSVRFNILGLINVNLPQSSAVVYGQLKLKMDCSQLNEINQSQKLKYKLINRIFIGFNFQEPLRLDEEGVHHITIQNNRFIYITIQKNYNLNLFGRTLCIPFQLIQAYLRINISCKSILYKRVEYKIRINCQGNYQQNKQPINYRGIKKTFYFFKIASKLLDCKFTKTKQFPFDQQQEQLEKQLNSNILKNKKCYQNCFCCCCFRKKKQQKYIDDKEQNTQRGFKQNPQQKKPNKYCHFKIPLSSSPWGVIFLVFIPFWVLGSITCLVFYQGHILSERLAIIGTLVLAHVALFPTVRQTLPPLRGFKCYQCLIILQLLCEIFLMLSSYYSQNQPDAKEFIQLSTQQKVLFLIVAGINISSFCIILILICCYQKKQKQISRLTSKSIRRYENQQLSFKKQNKIFINQMQQRYSEPKQQIKQQKQFSQKIQTKEQKINYFKQMQMLQIKKSQSKKKVIKNFSQQQMKSKQIQKQYLQNQRKMIKKIGKKPKDKNNQLQTARQ